ncbi:G-protein coupled receptor family C group 5 member C-like isoform X1 [Mustelus asterias]
MGAEGKMAARWLVVAWLVAMVTGVAQAALNDAPRGCRRGTNPIYFILCSLRAAWGIVFEALAAVGLLVTSLLALALLVCGRRRGKGVRGGARLALKLLVAAAALGLFGLVFAFVVEAHPINCSARRFLFGGLFGLAFASLAAQAGARARQAWTGRASSGLATLLVALGLFLLECLIKVEWLIATTVRGRPLDQRLPIQNPCHIAKKDFVASLVYVMVLLVVTLLLSAAALCSRRTTLSKRPAAYLLVTSGLSVAIWVAWIIVYLCSERRTDWRSGDYYNLRRDAWDDPPPALALLVNAWVLVLFCLVPWLVEMRRGSGEEEEEEDSSEGHEEIGLHKTSSTRAYAENKAFDKEDTLGKHYPYQDVKPHPMIKLESNPDPRASTGSYL